MLAKHIAITQEPHHNGLFIDLTLFHLGFLRVARLGGRGGGGRRKVPVAHNSKTIDDNGMKFGGVVESHKLINLV